MRQAVSRQWQILNAGGKLELPLSHERRFSQHEFGPGDKPRMEPSLLTSVGAVRLPVEALQCTLTTGIKKQVEIGRKQY
jgi:hypothetical protein